MTEHSQAAAESDESVSRRVAEEAAALLVQVRAEHAGAVDPADRRALGDDGDRRSNELILRRLAQARPEDAVLSEEAPDDAVRLTSDRVWIVDPLDGTAEYRTDRDEFAVHIALWERRGDEGVLRASTIALPDRSTTRTTIDDVAAPAPLDLAQGIRLVVSRSHLPTGFDVIVPRLEAALADAGFPGAAVTHYNVGSVGAKVDEVLAGRAAAYVFSGGLKEWDGAAPFAVAAHYGYVVSTAAGGAFRYNRPSPLMESGYVAHPAIAAMLAGAVADSGL